MKKIATFEQFRNALNEATPNIDSFGDPVDDEFDEVDNDIDDDDIDIEEFDDEEPVHPGTSSDEKDLYDIAAQMDAQDLLPNYSDVESEGEDVLRVDFGDEESLWLYKNGTIDGAESLTSAAKSFLRTKGFKV